MKVKLVVELGERTRYAIAHHFGQGFPPASHADCKMHLNTAIQAHLDDLMAQYQKFHGEGEGVES